MTPRRNESLGDLFLQVGCLFLFFTLPTIRAATVEGGSITPPQTCENDLQCNDGWVCTDDYCQGGYCKRSMIPECDCGHMGKYLCHSLESCVSSCSDCNNYPITDNAHNACLKADADSCSNLDPKHMFCASTGECVLNCAEGCEETPYGSMSTGTCVPECRQVGGKLCPSNKLCVDNCWSDCAGHYRVNDEDKCAKATEENCVTIGKFFCNTFDMCVDDCGADCPALQYKNNMGVCTATAPPVKDQCAQLWCESKQAHVDDCCSECPQMRAASQDTCACEPGWDIWEVLVHRQKPKVDNYLTVAELIGLAFKADEIPRCSVTFLAPNDDAWEKLGEAALNQLTKPESRDLLRWILKVHMIPKKLGSSALRQLGTVDTMIEKPVEQHLEFKDVADQGLHVFGPAHMWENPMHNVAKVVSPDNWADNGAWHGIDTVLTPAMCSPKQKFHVFGDDNRVLNPEETGLLQSNLIDGQFELDYCCDPFIFCTNNAGCPDFFNCWQGDSTVVGTSECEDDCCVKYCWRSVEALCRDQVQIDVGKTGTGYITADDVYNFDHARAKNPCMRPTFRSLSQDCFHCEDISATPTIELKVEDAWGHSDTCTTTVQVVDKVPPVLSCVGGATTTDMDGDDWSFDIDDADIVLSNYVDACDPNPDIEFDTTSWGCSDVGETDTLTVTVSDQWDNQAYCTREVFVANTDISTSSWDCTPDGVGSDRNPWQLYITSDSSQEVSLSWGDISDTAYTQTSPCTDRFPHSIDVKYNGKTVNSGNLESTSVDRSEMPHWGCGELGRHVVEITPVSKDGRRGNTCTQEINVNDNIKRVIECSGGDIVSISQESECGSTVSVSTGVAAVAPQANCRNFAANPTFSGVWRGTKDEVGGNEPGSGMGPWYDLYYCCPAPWSCCGSCPSNEREDWSSSWAYNE